MSFSHPSQVSATTGSDHQSLLSKSWCFTAPPITASRTTRTLCVLVIMTGPYSSPESSTQVVPVISPLPFWLNQPAKTASVGLRLPRGSTEVTPVRTTGSWPPCDPETIVLWPARRRARR